MHSNDNTSSSKELDNIHQLSQNISKQPFNVIAHKRIKKSKPIFTETRDMIKPATAPDDQPTKQNQAKLTQISQTQYPIKANLNRRFSTYQTHFSSHSKDKTPQQKLKMNQTVALKTKFFKQSATVSVSHKKKSDSSFQIGKLAQEGGLKKGMQKSMEKKFNQGPLKEKHLMNWLNQILIEYCFGLEFQKGQLKALQRFGLDQNSLLSRGMSLAEINRLYKMLFVYSMGFNTLLKELAGENRNVMKSIWKVYVMLLQYSSEGNFQTTMGELERDMIKNEERLMKEIQNRQIQINNNDEIMEERLYRYTKDNKDLTLKVNALEEKNEILEKEFREMEMAYNSEVTLRLAYQYRISEIYSVHQKLNILHLNMYKELQEKTLENKKVTKDCWTAKQGLSELKAYNEQLKGYLSDMKNSVVLNGNLIEGLRMNEQQLTAKLFAEMNVKREQVIQLREKQKKIVQLQREVSSGNLIIGMMKSAANNQLDEYKRLMMENSDLRRVSQSQLEKINQLLSDIKFLNSKESTLKSELQYCNIKITDLEGRIREDGNTIDTLSAQLDKKEIEYRTKCIELESQIKLVESITHNMSSVKALYEKLDEDNKYLQKYSQQMGQKFTQAHEKVMTLQLEVNALKEQKFDLQLEISRKSSQVVGLRKKYQADNDQQAKHYQKLHASWLNQDSNRAQLDAQLNTVRAQLEAANIRISFLSQQFTDMNFEKSKIQALYKDNLVLHERQKNSQKQLMIQMSQLTQQLEVSHRQIQVNHKMSQNQLGRLGREKETLQRMLKLKEAALKKKQGFVHPMLLEDALQTLKRQIETHYTTRVTLQNKVSQQLQKNSSLSLELQKKEVDFRHNIKQLQRRVQKMKSQMQGQRQYFLGKSEQLNTLIYNLETQLSFKSMEVDMKEDKNEAKYLQLVKNKNSQIQELLGELQRIEDSYQKKCTTYQSEIQHIQQEKESVISQLKESKKELEVKVVEIEKVYKQKLVEKQKEKEEVIQKMLQQRTAIHQVKEEEEEVQKQKPRGQNRRDEFIKRLKFANTYYKK